MEELRKIESDKGRKALLHPVRDKIVRLLQSERRTVTQTARLLDTHPANINHHFKLLIESQIIELVEERDIGRNIEKYYLATAQKFSLELNASEVESSGAAVLSFLRDDLDKAITELKSDDSQGVFGLIGNKKISSSRFGEFVEKITDLFQEFSDSETTDESESYSINLSLYPREPDYGPVHSYSIWKDGPLKDKLQSKLKKGNTTKVNTNSTGQKTSKPGKSKSSNSTLKRKNKS